MKTRTLFCLLTVALALPSLAGCNVGGAIGYKLFGPPAVEAQYVPPQEPMLVLVENYRGSAVRTADAETLGRYLMVELENHKVAPLIPVDKVYELRTSNPAAFKKMSMAALGREVGAKQVLYVDLQDCTIGAPPGSELLKGRVAVQVRVVDVETGATRWPAEATDGIPMAYETPLPRADENATEAIVRARMHFGMAERIAKLFYKWKPVDTTETLDMGESG